MKGPERVWYKNMKIVLNNEVAKRMAAILSNVNAEFTVLSFGSKLQKDNTTFLQFQAISPTTIVCEPIEVEIKAGKEEEMPELEQIFLDIKGFTKLIYAVCAYNEKIVLNITSKQVGISTAKGQASVKLGRLEKREVDAKMINPKEALIRAAVKATDLEAMLTKIESRARENQDKTVTLSFRVPEKAVYGYGANGSGNCIVRTKIMANYGKDGEPAEITELRKKAVEGSKTSNENDYRVNLSCDCVPVIKEFIQGSKTVQILLDKTHLCVRANVGILSCVLHAKESPILKAIDKVVAKDCDAIWQFDAGEIDKALNIINISQSSELKPCHLAIKENKAALVLPDNQGAKVDIKAKKGETELEMWVNPMLLKKAISFKGNLLIKLITNGKGGLFLVGPGTIEESEMDSFELVMLCASPDDNIAEEKPEKTAKAEKPKKEETKEEPKKEEAPVPVKETEDSDEEDTDDADDVEDIEDEDLDDDAEDVSDEDIPFEE